MITREAANSMRYSDELPVVRKRLLDLFPGASSRLASAFAEIDDTIRFARALGVTRPMFVRPAMPRRVAVRGAHGFGRQSRV